MSDQGSATQQWERRIETALDPGRYVSEHACFGYVADLEHVSAGVAGLVATDPGLAVSLYETFVAGCTEKADEIDDSSGEFGSFAFGLDLDRQGASVVEQPVDRDQPRRGVGGQARG